MTPFLEFIIAIGQNLRTLVITTTAIRIAKRIKQQ